MFKNLLPSKILSLNSKLISTLLIFMVLIFAIGLIYALILSPPDYIQGDSVRIMYVHVPASFIALSCFAIIGMISILNLVFKIKFKIDANPINPKQDNAIKEEGTCTYMILTESPWI